MLFHAPAIDPLVYATTAPVLTLIAVAATLPPARRAAWVDPMIAMQAELSAAEGRLGGGGKIALRVVEVVLLESDDDEDDADGIRFRRAT